MSGYSLGAVLSGLVAANVIPHDGWRAMYYIAAGCTLATLPLIYFFLPESLEFLLKARPKNALERSNNILSRMKVATLAALPELDDSRVKPSVAELLKPSRKVATIALWSAFFMSFATLYFLTSWIPKLASNTGLSVELAIYAGMVFNLGAFVGILSQGYLSARYGLLKVICCFMMGTAVLMLGFGLFKGSVLVLILFGLIGFGIQGGFVGLYSVAARLYPTEVRSTGVGWAIGAGRIGAIVGPLLGGVLIGAGYSMSVDFIIFAVPVVVAGVVVLRVRFVG